MDSFLRLPEVQKITGLSRSSIYFKASRGEFPQQIALGDRAVAFLESEVLEWMAQRVQLRGQAKPILTPPQQAKAEPETAPAE